MAVIPTELTSRKQNDQAINIPLLWSYTKQ